MRRWLVIGGAVGFGLIAVASVAAYVYFGRIGEWAVRSEILPELEERLGREVAVGVVDVGRREIVLENLQVAGASPGEPLVTIRRARIHYGLRSALRGRPEISLVVLEGARAQVELGGERSDEDLLDRLLGDAAQDAAGGGGGRSIRPARIVVEDAAVTVRDRSRDVTLSAREVEADLELGGAITVDIGHVGLVAKTGPSSSASDVRITADSRDPIGTAKVTIGEGRLSLAGGFSLSAIRGTLSSGDAGKLEFDLAGSYGGASEELWASHGWLDPRERTGELSLHAERFTLDRIAHVLAGAPIRKPEKAAIGASLRVSVGPEVASFRGDLDISGLTVAHRMLAPKPVEDLQLRANVSGEIDKHSRALAMDDAEIEVEGVRYGLDGYLALPGGVDPHTGEVREAARAGARLVVDPVDCQAMLDSIPEALVPRLQGFELRGEFSADVHVDVDLGDLDATELGGEVDIDGCRVVKAPPAVDASRLDEPFVHRVQVADDDWLKVVVGPKSPDFVPYEEVSPHLVNALMTTEDSGFFSHDGFVRRQFRTALVRNLEAGYFRYGASSITMQMVKNVLLHNEKTVSRKLQELFLTWYVESELDKERIMEIYLNAIEFGPGIYGIGAAARHYFGKRARDLNPAESAFFSSILPNPKGRYRQFCRGKLSRWTQTKIERVIDLMYERDRLTSIDHQIAQNTPLFFDRSHIDSETRCLQRVRVAIERAPRTTPALEGEDTGEVASR